MTNLSQHIIWPCTDPLSPYFRKVAYFSMEVAIDQSLKTYSGGLGFLAGSYLRSAHDQQQNIIGISLLWTKGYYTQNRASDRSMQVDFVDSIYAFLHQTGISFTVNVHGHEVVVNVLLLAAETFGTAPVFFLTTDIPENDYISRTITHRLYDPNTATRISQSIILGIGGGRLLDILEEKIDVYHLNEGHALPLAFYLYSKLKSVSEVVKHLVFTTHTPELAGNEEHELNFLNDMNFFNGLPLEEVKQITNLNGDRLNYTLTALRLSRKANAVSKIHGLVANKMWNVNEKVCPIISITNAQNKKYWVDEKIDTAFHDNDNVLLMERKKQLKVELFKVVSDQTGQIFDPEILTIVWARRFAGYKRATLLMKNFERFMHLTVRTDNPIQVIWAGKPYPEDWDAINTFNYLQSSTQGLTRCAVLTGYELELSAMLKKGADVWLNTPRMTREASGTSGMTAAMNGTLNLSVQDGWVPEFARHNENGFYLPVTNAEMSLEDQDNEDNNNLMAMLEGEVIPTYYEHSDRWLEMMKNSMKDIYPAFGSDRMVNEYYEKLYAFVSMES